MLRTRSRQSEGSSVNSAMIKGQAYRSYGILGSHDWWISSYSHYGHGAPTYSSLQYEVISDESHQIYQENQVSHSRIKVRSFPKGDGGWVYIETSRSTTYVYDGDTGTYGYQTTVWADAYQWWSRGWTPYSMTLTGAASPGHAADNGAFARARRSMIDDATKLFPDGDNMMRQVGELAELKSLLSSFRRIYADFFSKTAKGTGRALTSAYLTSIWALVPTADAIAQTRTMADRLYSRLNTLKKRKQEGKIQMSRRWSASENVEIGGQTFVKTTVNCLHCKAAAQINFDDEALLQSVVNRVVGVTNIFETIWALTPLSFAVDALFDAYGQKGLKDIAKSIDGQLEAANLWMNDIYLPPESTITMANWTYSQKTTLKVRHKYQYVDGPESLTCEFAETEYTQFDRAPVNNSDLTRLNAGISPNLNLAGSLGVIILNGRLR